ncbi:Hypothetical protein Cp106_0854 [Corynebacterium pseudotuberculosis 1/06-A]|nr:Hypothetical protein Cp106_0854 [Corynebacterium pseudotuberculosis 1/06-A]
MFKNDNDLVLAEHGMQVTHFN